MADPLYDLLAPHFPPTGPTSNGSLIDHATAPSLSDPVTTKYLARLPKLDLAALSTSEPQSLAQASHSNLLAIQGLSSRSAKSLIASSDHLAQLSGSLPLIEAQVSTIRDGVGQLDNAAVAFSNKYSRSAGADGEVLERRKRALLLLRNADRVGEMLELPTLLSSAVHSAGTHSASTTVSAGASGGGGGGGGGGTSGGGNTYTAGSAASTSATYNSALDLYGHVKRLATLYPESDLVRGIGQDAGAAMREMTTNLIQTLRGPNLKLAGGMRAVGWLRRVAPELAATEPGQSKATLAMVAAGEEEGALGALFLVCRLANLLNTLEALEPLRDLADQETRTRIVVVAEAGTASRKAERGGHQTGRYLKRFIELFREQSFGIISMFRSIFPAEGEDESIDNEKLGVDIPKVGVAAQGRARSNQPKPEALPSALATFPLHLISNILIPELKKYLPNVQDKSVRESLLTQVLYCAGSLGRLGGDFSIMLTDLYEEDDSESDEDSDQTKGGGNIAEWIDVMKKHRIQAARLEALAATGRA